MDSPQSKSQTETFEETLADQPSSDPETFSTSGGGNVLDESRKSSGSKQIKEIQNPSINETRTNVWVYGVTNEIITYTLLPQSSVNTIYVLPINGPISIKLGTLNNCNFPQERVVVIKDMSLCSSLSSSYNVSVSSGSYSVLLTDYGTDGRLRKTSDGSYTLNTVEGSVTLNYTSCLCNDFNAPINSWSIINQFIGNPRLVARSK